VAICITGGSSGLGRAIAERFARSGIAPTGSSRAWTKLAASCAGGVNRDPEPGSLTAGTDFSRAVAVGLYRVLAAKDEYEVARLLTAPEFAAWTTPGS